MPPGVLVYPREVILPGVIVVRLDLALDLNFLVIGVDAALRLFRVQRCFIQLFG